ncbi:PD-(D/E)XK nuclease family protein [Bifidobacterium sp. 82T10]|uniref:PD-(D/E)XK nuclease family protein n=1 Tax=Bifidobacterium miconis TaxID=2834435 RepID=A0ABS6WC04_9BIFI|nr:PD-(D/E)XK nuclease family protein [Bifidobacterium miconis]MBW3091487.1 PD-(D/E)XK nuclease family protein [Bifidobacterium miconis]
MADRTSHIAAAEVPAVHDDLHRVIQQAVTDAAAGENGDLFIILTPARLRTYAERATLEYLGKHPIGRPGVTVNVHSFASLVRSVIGNRDAGKYAKPMLGSFALREWLAALMRQDPATFRKAGDTFGSASQFANQIAELFDAGITADDLERAAAADPANGMLADDRMAALAILLRAAERRFGDARVLPGGNAAVAWPWIEDRGNTLHVYLYGFEKLSAAEARAVSALQRHAHMTVCDEPGYRADITDAIFGSSSGRHAAASDHARLPEPIPVDPGRVVAMSAADEMEEVRAVACLIRELHDHGGADGAPVPYERMLVTARDLSPYRAMLDSEFTYQGIPVNATPAATLADGPFADLLLGLLDERLYEERPDRAAVMRVFRTRLLRDPHRQWRITNRDLDRLDRRLQSEDPAAVWSDGEHRTTGATVTAIRALINEARPAFMPPTGTGLTVREILARMVRFLADHRVNLSWRLVLEESSSDKDRHDSAELEQRFTRTREAWNLVMHSFDELVELCGDEPYDDIRATLPNGLETLLAATPAGAEPKSTDAVDVVAFPTAMRHYDRVFVLGCSESALPAIPHESGLLNDTERLRLAETLATNGKTIEAAIMRSLSVHGKARREVLAFNRVLRHAGRITLLCPRNAGGASQTLSPFAARLLPNLSDGQGTRSQTIDDLPFADNIAPNGIAMDEQDATDDRAHRPLTRPVDRNPLDGPVALALFTTTERNTGERVLETSISAAERYYANPFETFMDKGLHVKALEPFALDAAIEGLFYHAVLERTVDVLIATGKNPASVSKTYRADDGTPLDAHALVNLFADPDWHPSPLPEYGLNGQSLIDEEPKFAIFLSGNRMKAVHRQLVQRLHAFVDRLHATRGKWKDNLLTPLDGEEQPLVTTTRPLFAEQQFGDINGVKGDWDPVTHQLTGHGDDGPTEVRLDIRGKVDRIDEVTRGDDKAAFVIDYKSSGSNYTLFADMNGAKVYYGHELQLLTYAYAAMRNLHEQRPDLPVAGVMFLPIKASGTGVSATVKPGTLVFKPADDATGPEPSGKPADKQADPNEQWTMLFAGAEGRLPGIACKAKNTPLDIGDMGLLVQPWQCRTTPSGKAATSALPSVGTKQKDFAALLEYVQNMIVRACQNMLDGRVSPSPYRNIADEKNGAQYSDFKDAMALDLVDGRAWHYERPLFLQDFLDRAASGEIMDRFATPESAVTIGDVDAGNGNEDDIDANDTDDAGNTDGKEQA